MAGFRSRWVIHFSCAVPDGRWVVYAARETGREEQVYVQPYPGPGGRVVISPGGGIEPVWSPTGREIFYRSVDGTRMMSVDVRTEPTLTVGDPRFLFPGRFVTSDGSYWSNYDVSARRPGVTDVRGRPDINAAAQRRPQLG